MSVNTPVNSLINTLASTLLISALFCFSTSVTAWTLTVVDQDGKPTNNAIVHIMGANIQSEATSIAIMDQIDREYSPHVLPIHTNQKVSFPNSDNVRHHIYSFSTAKQFEVKLYAGTPQSPILFENPGIVVLGCNIQDSMLGYIAVYDSGKFNVVDSKGRVSFDQPLSSLNAIAIWHPNLKKPNDTNYLSLLASTSKNANNDITTITIDINHPAPKKKSKKNKFGRYSR